jgi:hypothetical protein
MSVEWNGESFKLAMRQAVAKGLTETARLAANEVTVRMPRASVIGTRKSRKTGATYTLYATPSSPPGGYPARRTSSLANSITYSFASPDNLRAAFGVFGGKEGPQRVILDGVGADGYPKYLEFKPISSGGRRWARRTVTENQKKLALRFQTAAKREFARAAPR